MGLNISLGHSKKDSQDFLNHVLLGSMIKAIMDYEQLPASKKNLNDEHEYWARQAMMNLTVKFSPWALFNHYRKYLSDYKNSPFIMSFSKAIQNNKTAGNDRPYTISEAERIYGGGWVNFVNHWSDADTFGKAFKKITPVLAGIATGLVTGGPVGAVLGAVGGTAKAIANSKIESKALQVAAKQEILDQQTAAIQANEEIAQKAAGLINFKGPELWVLSILILAGLYLMFKK